MSGWATECDGSNKDVCEVFVDDWKWMSDSAAAPIGAPPHSTLADFNALLLGRPTPTSQAPVRKKTCRNFCRLQGLWCEAAWDNRNNGCLRQVAQSTMCDVQRSNQICRCRRKCVDRAPMLCREEGCPNRTVGCDMLAAADVCRVLLSDIWRKPEANMMGLLVEQACPLSCAQCSTTA